MNLTSVNWVGSKRWVEVLINVMVVHVEMSVWIYLLLYVHTYVCRNLWLCMSVFSRGRRDIVSFGIPDVNVVHCKRLRCKLLYRALSAAHACSPVDRATASEFCPNDWKIRLWLLPTPLGQWEQCLFQHLVSVPWLELKN